MEYLWKKGVGVVYRKTLEWLKSSDENLLIAGALAAGNFARKGLLFLISSYFKSQFLWG